VTGLGVCPMSFRSILFNETGGGQEGEALAAPGFLVDLNLDQIIDAVTAGKQEYHLQPFFHMPLHDVDAIEYRHEVFRDLEDPILFDKIKAFAGKMRSMREHLAQAEKLYYTYQKESWFLDAVRIYCDAVKCLMADLALVDLKSRGFQALWHYLTSYAASDRFTSLLAETDRCVADLAGVRYWVHIKDNCVKVRKFESGVDYSADVEETFRKFQLGAVKDYRAKLPDWQQMNQVEAQILECVARLHPEVFLNLDDYCAQHAGYLDEVVGAFDREVQFYISYLEHLATIKRAGLHFCYPAVSATSKEVYDREGFDLALARNLIRESSPVVVNDFCLKGPERIFVVSGPNQGGKTTFARTFGQLHYLASLGCPVPGTEAQLFLYDQLFTHFEKEEAIQDLTGKLEDDLLRVHAILQAATSNSLIIINEMFTSTTLQDAVFLSQQVMHEILKLDLLCVWITFVEELASAGEKVVSMVSTVMPENPALRTYRIVRRPADGLAYAISIAEKYRLTYDCLQERMSS